MKYRITYKGLDGADDLNKITKFMESLGYKSNLDYKPLDDIILLLFSKKNLDNPEETTYFEINDKYKTVKKYIVSMKVGIADIKFTNEELKFFDLLDYELDSVYEDEKLTQYVTDWADKNEV